MIPANRLSTTTLSSDLLPPRDIPYQPLSNYELGGVALSDPSQGLLLKPWQGQVIGNDIVLSADAVAPTVIVSDVGITEMHFTFDQNMRPFVCWVADGQAKFYWFDSTIEDYTTTIMDPAVVTPRCTLDDKRLLQSGASDIILSYVRANALYFRMQRDRYLVEYPLLADVKGLVQVGMGRNNRLQFIIRL